jgi:GNAT superfamily N-acetyltransferase
VSLVLDECAVFTGDLTSLALAGEDSDGRIRASWRRLLGAGARRIYPGHVRSHRCTAGRNSIAEPMIHIRHADPADAADWLALRAALWPEAAAENALEADVARFFVEPAPKLPPRVEAVLVAVDPANTPTIVGFVELTRRAYSEGCDTSPVAFLEGWYVSPSYRRRGVGRLLIAAAEAWGRGQGCTEFASDALADNLDSAAAHLALGFEEVEVTRYFRKDLGSGEMWPAPAPPPSTRTILWRRIDQPGHDAARLWESTRDRTLEGTAIFDEGGRACRLDYRVVCDASWRTHSAIVRGWLGHEPFEVTVAAGADRGWTINGAVAAAVQGCEDVDLSFTPATNLLPIRRLGLAVGQKASVRAAWLNFPSVALVPLDQSYERVAAAEYRYESDGGSFVATLSTSADGFVQRYSGLWEAETR